MRGIKFKIIYIIGLLVLSLSISVTFAAFIFNQTAKMNANIGQVAVSSKSFYKYNKFDTEQTNSRLNKLRKDTVYLIDNIKIDSTEGYRKTTDGTYQTGIKYYDKTTLEANGNNAYDQSYTYYQLVDSKYTKLDVSALTFDSTLEGLYRTLGEFKKALLTDAFIETQEYYYTVDENGKYQAASTFNSSNTYYILLKEMPTTTGSDTTKNEYVYVKEYSNISSAEGYEVLNVSPYLTDKETVNVSNNVLTIDFLAPNMVLTCTVDDTNGVVNGVVITTGNTNSQYKAVIDYKGLSISIINTTITNSTDGYVVAKDNEDKPLDSIICSASETKYTDSDKIYLSQLGLHFEFKTEIAVYIRIHIQDAWIRTRKYSATNIRQLYIQKDQIEGKSPFAVNDDEWYFDEKENCIYLKTRYVPEPILDASGNPVKDANGKTTYKAKAYTFNINEGYYFDVLKSISYTDFIDVQVAFIVDIVQANRAYALWGFDPSERDYING